MTQGGWVAHLCLILCLYVDKVSCLCLVYEQLKIEIKKKLSFHVKCLFFKDLGVKFVSALQKLYGAVEKY